MKTVKIIEKTPSAYPYPLLIKNILNTPLIYSPDQEIVYSDQVRYSYRTLADRIAQLANALTNAGVGQGDTAAIMDWDSHRYLECFFAVPMMGAVLHTINIRLSVEQLVYTINHAEDDILLINEEFIPLLEPVRDQLNTVKNILLLSDENQVPDTPLQIDSEYENLLSGCAAEYDFPDFDEDAMATTFYTTGTTGLPKGVFYSHRQLVLHGIVQSSQETEALSALFNRLQKRVPAHHVRRRNVATVRPGDLRCNRARILIGVALDRPSRQVVVHALVLGQRRIQERTRLCTKLLDTQDVGAKEIEELAQRGLALWPTLRIPEVIGGNR